VGAPADGFFRIHAHAAGGPAGSASSTKGWPWQGGEPRRRLPPRRRPSGGRTRASRGRGTTPRPVRQGESRSRIEPDTWPDPRGALPAPGFGRVRVRFLRGALRGRGYQAIASPPGTGTIEGAGAGICADAASGRCAGVSRTPSHRRRAKSTSFVAFRNSVGRPTCRLLRRPCGMAASAADFPPTHRGNTGYLGVACAAGPSHSSLPAVTRRTSARRRR